MSTIRGILALVTILSSGFLAVADEPFEAREIAYTGGPYENEVFRYRLLTPKAAKPGETYPLVLFLHGIRSDASRFSIPFRMSRNSARRKARPAPPIDSWSAIIHLRWFGPRPLLQRLLRYLRPELLLLLCSHDDGEQAFPL